MALIFFFGIVGMQTNDTLNLNSKVFMEKKEIAFLEANFKAKLRFILSSGNKGHFNGCKITIGKTIIYMQQKKRANWFELQINNADKSLNYVQMDLTQAKLVIRNIFASEIYGMVSKFNAGYVLKITLSAIRERLKLPFYKLLQHYNGKTKRIIIKGLKKIFKLSFGLLLIIDGNCFYCINKKNGLNVSLFVLLGKSRINYINKKHKLSVGLLVLFGGNRINYIDKKHKLSASLLVLFGKCRFYCIIKKNKLKFGLFALFGKSTFRKFSATVLRKSQITFKTCIMRAFRFFESFASAFVVLISVKKLIRAIPELTFKQNNNQTFKRILSKRNFFFKIISEIVNLLTKCLLILFFIKAIY
ncbi:hypothetical protein GGTG_11555 [Gaeumannomyces tritici R3-111a-1]|uniref:Uncharacterized protein n=1 Tax=Gaeumannomyces tritici (strain R3-111a-1) TaxID=644352 RepID=J3PDI2_GAET3|nr:hypothetical protein GGTG_11555 [Gaeumannomyces tritici R3-111a-1]EJT70532.1 hypothetical protein GGTG_11555 [Gaeumannomyces tritici R3-111a-1]